MTLKVADCDGSFNLIRMVISNLISNAIKYSPADARIWIEGEKRAEGGMTIAVHDEGPGIPQSEIKHIFERFYRASTSTGVAGTGIGLFLAAALVDIHGGKFDVMSDDGKGTTISVHLPDRAAA